MWLTILTDGPARVEVRDEQQRMHRPVGALIDRTVGDRPEIPPYYQGHFVTTGRSTLNLPPGRYTVIVEKGLEFERRELGIDLDGDRTVTIAPQRWADLPAENWWSGDMHVHRPVADMPTLLSAENLNLAAVFTMWTGNEQPNAAATERIVRADSTHVATTMNAEDERSGGAWMFHDLDAPLPLAGSGWWYPHGGTFISSAREQHAWFDCEKPVWWEVPVIAALFPFDSMGILNNHYTQYGMNAAEAWGRPRDTATYPGAAGFSDYCVDLYYRYLNLGHRLPATAGSASGVLPSPPGYNRTYVHIPGEFSVEPFYANLRRGRSFVTNGPTLAFTADGHDIGEDLERPPGSRIRIAARARAREPIDRIEIIADGRIVHRAEGSDTETDIDSAGFTWIAARCYLATGHTVRLAHTSPIYLHGPGRRADVAAEQAYFGAWIDELIAQTEADTERFDTPAQREEIMRIYRAAREHYRTEPSGP